MENALAIAAVMGPAYLVLGLSVLFYVDSWMKFLKECSASHYGLWSWGMMSMILGLVVINMYNVWEWNVWLLVTLSGWVLFLKALFYWLAPGEWTRACFSTCNNTNWLYFSSLVSIVAGAALSYYVYLV